jgi:mRNA-degrading endonuclease RelE of RelBE toxin-antitoxin system
MSRLPILRGSACALDWASGSSGRFLGKDYYDNLNDGERAKFYALFERLARDGRIHEKTRFRKETDNVFGFKSDKHRLFCFFDDGTWFLVLGFKKKSNKDKKLTRALQSSERIRFEYLDGQTGD